MKFRKLKKVVAGILTCTMMLTLTGCGEQLTNFAGATFDNLEHRFDDNIAMAEILYRSNIINETTFENIKSRTNKVVRAFSLTQAYMETDTDLESILKVLRGEEVIIKDENNDEVTVETKINLLNGITGVVPIAQPPKDGDNSPDVLYDTSVIEKDEDVYTKEYEYDGTKEQLHYIGFANFLLSSKLEEKYKQWNLAPECAVDTVGYWFFREEKLAKKIPTEIWGRDTVHEDGWNHFMSSMGEDQEFVPIRIIGISDEKEVVKAVQTILDRPIYVLRPDIGAPTDAGAASLDKFKDAKAAIQSEDIDQLMEYFYSPTVNGKPLTLNTIIQRAIVEHPEELGELDNIKDKLAESMIGTSTWNDAVYKDENGKIEYRNENGKDIIMRQFGQPVASFRVREFDYRVCTLINSATGLFNNAFDDATKYKIINNGNEQMVFMLEYDISAIGQFTSTKGATKSFNDGKITDNVKVTPSYTPAGMAINIMNGKILKYMINPANGKYLQSGLYIQDSDFYLNSALYDSGKDTSSFAIIGYQAMNIGVKGTSVEVWREGEILNHNYETDVVDIDQDYAVYVPRIVLIDYLEAAFAPGWNKTEDVAVFGRKLRFSVLNSHLENTGSITINVNDAGGARTLSVNQYNLTYDRYNHVATFVTKTGNLKESHLQITDFCDLPSLVDPDINSKVVKIITPLGAKDAEIPAVASKDWASDQPDTSELAYSAKTTCTIQPTRMFPGPNLDNADYQKDVEFTYQQDNALLMSHFQSTQRFWTITTKKGIFDSGLYLTWIESSTPDASLGWWNGYLQSHHFEYYLAKDKVTNYLLDNYLSQMQRAGVVIIDPDVVEDLQEYFGKETDIQRAATIKTTFAVVGWAIVALALILLLIWVMDTNTDLGLNLLNKVTFGHWIAVKYKADIPEGTASGVTYMSGGKVMIRCLIIIAVGILLITINALDIVVMLVEAFGGVAAELEKIIRGS